MNKCGICGSDDILSFAYGLFLNDDGKTLSGRHGNTIYAGCIRSGAKPDYRCAKCLTDFFKNGSVASTKESREAESEIRRQKYKAYEEGLQTGEVPNYTQRINNYTRKPKPFYAFWLPKKMKYVWVKPRKRR